MVVTVFTIALEPVNEHITTEGLEAKLKLMAGCVGLRVLSAKKINESNKIGQNKIRSSHESQTKQN